MTGAPEPFDERAFRFACTIVRLYVDLQKTGQVPLALARQLLNAGTSIGANLEEAKAAQSRRDVAAKFCFALKEARETVYWLRLLTETGLVRPAATTAVANDARELVAILTVSLRRLRNQPEPGRTRSATAPGG